MTNLDSILKTETLLCQKKVHLVKSVLFPIVMYWCDIWSIKKAQCQRNDTFELWCWRRLLWVPWTARRSNQSILKEINPEYLKSWLTGKDPEAGKDWKQEEKGMTEGEMVGWHHQVNGHEFEQAPGDSEGQGSMVCCILWRHRIGHNWATEQKYSFIMTTKCPLSTP